MATKQETRKALLDSVRKWYSASRTGDFENMRKCALCSLFNKRDDAIGSRCRECPVYLRTGFRGCTLTPYEAWSRSREEHPSPRPGSAEFESQCDAALEEARFLASILREMNTQGTVTLNAPNFGPGIVPTGL